MPENQRKIIGKLKKDDYKKIKERNNNERKVFDFIEMLLKFFFLERKTQSRKLELIIRS
jgi:hypothetical protein